MTEQEPFFTSWDQLDVRDKDLLTIFFTQDPPRLRNLGFSQVKNLEDLDKVTIGIIRHKPGAVVYLGDKEFDTLKGLAVYVDQTHPGIRMNRLISNRRRM